MRSPEGELTLGIDFREDIMTTPAGTLRVEDDRDRFHVHDWHGEISGVRGDCRPLCRELFRLLPPDQQEALLQELAQIAKSGAIAGASLD